MIKKMLKLSYICCIILSLSCTNATGISGDKGTEALNFAATDLNGNPVAFGAFLGKEPIFLVFFATWCPPCRTEVSELVRINDEYTAKGLKVLAVSVDNSRTVLPGFIKETGINYTVWHDADKEAGRVYKIVGIPTNILIDRGGIITFRQHHPPSSKEIESILD